ncbi:MAG TPA: T9SS type A sorting domain-containing protein [Chitinophagales bacterium]|nr:T9SS type A sorting domain-containing protein [Chitinophagales bacterium]HMX59443.1 T9SS type A sorting domain-containing protein [Chitinophagales bacterium]HMY22450.1 T9SS type A sorting domain-containing protein [Chitinophagales bacterium]HNA38262.1 T9SS type A sorting domain-containing protein [Chitinophagales bacterium]HNC71838.1 T9SS type A sorting domain-containing protein [Chitinophagales bacterium]
MRRFFTLLFFCISLSAFSQIRYKDEMFSISKHTDVMYGRNYDNKNQLTDLLMDVYEPQSDTAALRPIIFFVHGGSFVGGDRQDQSIDEIAEFFAKKGYVTANIEYRVQQTTLISPFVDFADMYNWYRAITRASHDLKAAIRYVKKDVATNYNQYKVDTNSIFIYGSSAGAITALHTVFLDDTLEMNPQFRVAFREMGGLDGNSGNLGYSMKGIKAIVSCSGAIADLNYMNNNRDIEYLGFHNNPDLTVPFDVGCFVTVACWLGNFYGANKIFPKIRNNGTYAEFYPVNRLGHPVDQVSDTVARPMILQKTTDFLYRIMNQQIVTSIRNNVVQSFELFPNPSKGNFTIQLPRTLQYKAVRVVITDVVGKNVFSVLVENKENIDINVDLANGIYVVSIIADEQQYLSKLTIQQ